MKTEKEFVAALLRWFGLNESVRTDQSFEAQREELRVALNLWSGRPANDMRVAWTFSDRLIAYVWIESADSIERKAWEIAWARTDGAIIFSDPVEVREIQTYEPVTESQRKGGGQRLTETLEQTLTLSESQADAKGARRVKAVGITADVVNRNGRRYPRRVLADAVAKLSGHLHESNGQGNLIATGEAEHPSDKGGRASILETVVKWEAASLDGTGRVLLEGAILPTAKGKDIEVLVENGVPIGVSMRGYGTSKAIQESGETVQEVVELTIRGFDLVAQPSDPNGAITEAQQVGSNQEKSIVTEEEKRALEEAQRKQQQELEEAQRKLAEQTKALEEGQKAQAELAEHKRLEAVDAAITESTKDLKYGDGLNALFVGAVKAAKPESPEAVKALVEAKRKEYDGIASSAKLTGMGRGVQVTGPVFEHETGQPEYTRAAWELNESLIKSGEGQRLSDKKALTPAGIYAKRVLERFDQVHGARLMVEARMFEEAETDSDLSLPYSVARMLIEQAYPELIAASIYDFGVTDMAPAKVYFESYAGDAGSYATITDEAMTASTSAFVALAHKRLRPGTVVVTNSGGTVTYNEGTDYVVDYEIGAILAIATITNSQSILVDYTYDAFREGEMAAIERAENNLTSTQLDIAADRLAMEISNEAIVFSRSQLAYDAVTRTLGNLARLVRRKIDKDILYKGLSASLRQANNSGGTWTASSDAISLLVQYLGVAKTKVYNRFYTPTAIIMSVTNSDRLSNWEGYRVTGFSDALLNSAGFAGQVKGLPIFASPEYPDGWAQVVHRELVMHRVYQPMVFKGPFPSFSNGKLVASEQYYAEEYNGSLVPVKEKSSHVKIA